jgi:hypothetical protein
MAKKTDKQQTSDWRNCPKSWFWLLTEWQKDQNPEKIQEALQNLKRLGYTVRLKGGSDGK